MAGITLNKMLEVVLLAVVDAVATMPLAALEKQVLLPVPVVAGQKKKILTLINTLKKLLDEVQNIQPCPPILKTKRLKL